ncbi:MAG TPA: discoidin domain-containing protein, partial [Bryobacteraceae bacterium]|nr:discoidin domain-containing protein [Bryobacteraceae bacterium]
AIACKITAFGFLIYGIIAVAMACALWRAVVFATIAGLPVLPWLAKNIVQFHNPVFPLMNRWFPNPFMYPMVEDEMRRITAHVGNVMWPQIPWQATTGGLLGGIIGPVFLLAPIALLSLRRRGGRQALAAFACVMLPFAGNIGARFLIPALPFLGLGMAIALTHIPRFGSGLAGAVLVAHALLSWPPWIERWSAHYQWRIEEIEWRAALRITPEWEFLRTHWPDYERGLLLDRFVAPGEKVFSPNMGQMAYQRREVIGTSDSALGRRVFLTYLMPLATPLGSTWKRDLHFPEAMTRKIRLVATDAQDADMRISEIRFFKGELEIPRNSKWRISASSNPWEAPLAFDNGAVSFWSSGTKTEPGMWIGVDFGETVGIDHIILEQNADQRWTSIQPEMPDGEKWRRERARYVGTELPPAPDLRMATRDELRRLGIKWILMPDSQYGATDVRDHTAEWGVAQAGMANDFRLWKLLPAAGD